MKLGIIVPYRERESHLKKFLDGIKTYFKTQNLKYEVIVVEQLDDKPFNRGKLLNIGYIKARELGCEYIVFHDVDMIPIEVDYSYSELPMHLATNFELEYDKSKNLIFDDYFGGVTMFTADTFEKINESRLIDLTIVIDSDNFYDIDIISKAKNYNTNSIFYIKNSNPLPLFSYILIDNNDNVTSIKEKIKISDNACVGAYCFKSANFLKQLIESVIYKNKTQKNEFYISNLYDEILDLNDNIKGIEINKFNCLGTPKQLMDFCIENIEHTRFNNIYVQIDISDLFDNGSENENYLNIFEDIFHLLDKIIALGIKIDFYVNKNISDIDIKNKILILDQKSTNVNYRFLNADIFKYSLRFKLTTSTTSADIEKELGLYFNKNYIHDK
jgi:hypothetical protein